MGIIRTLVERVRVRWTGAMGQYNLVKPDLIDSEASALELDIHGNLLVAPAAGVIWVVGGPVAQDEPVSGNPVEISYEANAFALGAAFAPNVPVSADGDVVRPRASRYGVQYGMLVSQNGEHTVQIFGGQANPDPNPTYGIPPMAIRRDNPNPPLEGDNEYIPLTTDEHGALWVALDPYVAPMNATSSAYTVGDRGVHIHAVRNDNAATVVADADREYSSLSVDDRGQLYVRFGPSSGGPVYAEDSAFVDQELGFATWRVRRDVPASSGGSDGDHVTPNQDSDGYDYTRDKALDAGANANRVLPVNGPPYYPVGPTPLIAANQTIADAAADLGGDIACTGMKYLRLNLEWSKGDGNCTTIKVRCMIKSVDGGANEYPIPTIKTDTTGANYIVTCDDEWVTVTLTDASGKRTLEWALNGTAVAAQIRVMKGGAPGVTTMAVVAAGTDVVLAY